MQFFDEVRIMKLNRWQTIRVGFEIGRAHV